MKNASHVWHCRVGAPLCARGLLPAAAGHLGVRARSGLLIDPTDA